MKNIKLSLFALLTASLLTLGACSQPPAPSSSETPSSSEVSSSEEPSSETPSSSEEPSSEVPSSSEEPEPSSSEPSSEEPSSEPSSEEKELSYITLSGSYQTVFNINDTFDYEGLIVTATYSDNSNKEVNNYTVSSPDMTLEGEKEVVVSYSENSITKNAKYYINVIAGDINEYRQAAIMQVSEAFDELDIDDYSPRQWEKIMDALNTAIKGINISTSTEEINEYLANALELFASVMTQEECVAGTLFDYNSGGYYFDRSEEGNLLIQYDGRPGHWTYVGTRNLDVNLNRENIFTLTFRNNIDESIYASLKLGDESHAYEVESGLQRINGHETKTFQIAFDNPVQRLYFFVDASEDHNRKGEVEILDYGFTYEERERPDIPETKTIDMNDTAFTIDTPATYTLTEDDTPYNISRIGVSFVAEFNENWDNDSMKYYQISIAAGSNKHNTNNEFYTQSFEDDSAEYGLANIEILTDKKLTAGNAISVNTFYCADGLTFYLESLTLYYSEWNDIDTERIEVNKTIWENSADNGETVQLNYSDFAKKGRVNKMEIEFITMNDESWAGSQIYISGFNFTNFPTKNNNVLNTSSIMDKDHTGLETTGVMTIYPLDEIDLTKSIDLQIDCWWASGSLVIVKSITMYTDLVSA